MHLEIGGAFRQPRCAEVVVKRRQGLTGTRFVRCQWSAKVTGFRNVK